MDPHRRPATHPDCDLWVVQPQPGPLERRSNSIEDGSTFQLARDKGRIGSLIVGHRDGPSLGERGLDQEVFDGGDGVGRDRTELDCIGTTTQGMFRCSIRNKLDYRLTVIRRRAFSSVRVLGKGVGEQSVLLSAYRSQDGSHGTEGFACRTSGAVQ